MTDTPVFADFTKLLQAVLGDSVDQTVQGLSDLMAEDAVMEFPYALPELPRQVAGRPALEKHLRHIEGLFIIDAHTDPVVHRTENPDVIILEYSLSGRIVSNGLPFEQTYISVITLENKKIAHFKDYWNPVVTQRLTSAMS